MTRFQELQCIQTTVGDTLSTSVTEMEKRRRDKTVHLKPQKKTVHESTCFSKMIFTEIVAPIIEKLQPYHTQGFHCWLHPCQNVDTHHNIIGVI